MDKVVESLRQMHNIERFATEIYRMQIRAFPEKEIADRLRAARANEQEHVDDLQAHIRELGGSTSRAGALFQAAGKLLGSGTTLLGKTLILRFDIRVEERAVRDYTKYLETVAFDEKSRKLIEKNLQDEKAHIERWQDSLTMLKVSASSGSSAESP